MKAYDAADLGKAARMITVIIFPTMVTLLFFCVNQKPFTKAEEKKNDNSDVEASASAIGSDKGEDKETSERLTKSEMIDAFKEIRFLFVPICKIHHNICAKLYEMFTNVCFFLMSRQTHPMHSSMDSICLLSWHIVSLLSWL